MKKLILIFSIAFVIGVYWAVKQPEKSIKISNSVEEAFEWLKTTSTSTTTTTITTTVPQNVTTTTVKAKTGEITTTEWHYRGFLVDTHGIIIMSNEGDKRVISKGYEECLGNVLDGYNSSLGLDRVFEDMLRQPNLTTKKLDGEHPIGQSIVLSLDADLQKNIYDYMKSHNIIGSTTILLGDGAVRALVSFPSYNPNVDLTEQVLEPHACCNRCVESAVPGSTFKILSSVVAEDHCITENSDPGYIFGVSNWDVKDKKPYATSIKRSLREAFRFSSNCWYAQLYYDLGADKVSESLDKYFSYSTPIQTDFCVLTNDINLSSNSALCRAGFGQREHMSPLYIAMCSNAVITGELNAVYISRKQLDTVTWEDISELNNNKNTISTIPASLTHETKLGMRDVASDLGLTVNRPDVKLFVKTGTAEISDDKDIHYILVTGSDEANKPENTTTIVFQYLNSDKEYASGDRDHMQAILNMVYKEEKS